MSDMLLRRRAMIAAQTKAAAYNGIEFVGFTSSGQLNEANFHGTPERKALYYCWYASGDPVLLHLVDKPQVIGYQAFANALVELDTNTLTEIVEAGEQAFAVSCSSAANNLSSKTLSLPSFTGAGGSSRFRIAGAYGYGTFYLPKMQSVHNFDWYQNGVNGLTVQIGSIGYPVTAVEQRPFGGSYGSGTITVFTTGALLDSVKTAIQNQAGANYTFVYKAAETTEYGGVGYAAGDTILTSSN